MATISLESRLQRCPRVLDQQATGTTVLLNLEDGEYFALDGIGGRVWELCRDGRTLAEVAATLSEEYDAPLPVIQEDVLELVTDLVREKLIREEA
jgi:hypothetical protein